MADLVARHRRPLLCAAAAIMFFGASVIGRLAAMQASGLEAFWPSNAIILAMLLLWGRNGRDICAIAAGAVSGGILLHVLLGDTIAGILLLGAANIIESLLAFTLLRVMGIRHGLIDRVGNFFALALACCLTGLVSSTIGAAGLWLGRSIPFWDGWHSWYVSGVLSALMVTPSVMVTIDLMRRRRRKALTLRTLLEIVAMLALVAAAASLAFYGTGLPLTFIVSPFVLFATFRFRAVGAVGAVAIVTTVAVCATASGNGPIAHLLQRPGDQVLLLQLFVAATLLSALPVAAVLNERNQKAAETRAFAEHFRSVVENIGEVIFRIDLQGRWSYLNPAWVTLTGQPIEVSLGQSWSDRVDANARDSLRDEAAAVLSGQQPFLRQSVRFGTLDGLRWVELFVQALTDPKGRVVGATGTMRDIDDRKQLEEHVISAKRHAEQRAREATLLAATDELTGLANRRAFMGQLDREIAGAAEFGWPLAVAMFDVDHFKSVNDRYGHAIGDRVLQLIAARAATVVRGGDLVGRLGGEEFGVLMPGTSLQEAQSVAERLREAMQTSREVDDSLPAVTISIGIAAREDQRSALALLEAADAALYAAKDEGRNRVRVAA